MVQLIARKMRMMRKEKMTLSILLQIPISKLIQLMSSGGGGWALLTNRTLLLNVTLLSGVLMQQQHKFRAQLWQQFWKR